MVHRLKNIVTAATMDAYFVTVIVSATGTSAEHFVAVVPIETDTEVPIFHRDLRNTLIAPVICRRV